MPQYLVFLFTLFLPVGWAKHWIVPNSLVNGVLVDYLMPDLWIQDLLAMMVIIANFQFSIFNFQKNSTKFQLLITDYLLPITLVLISIILSPIPLISTINFIRFLVAGFVGLIIYKNKDLHKPALLGLSGAVVWTSILALGQFLNQATVIGWQFLGEPIFTSGSGGVKKILLFGRNIVLPMATFPHANVMGAFGLLAYLVLARHSEEGNHEESLDRGIFHLRLTQVQNDAFNKASKWLSLVLILLSFSLPVWLIAIFLFLRKLNLTRTDPNLTLGLVFLIFLFLLATNYQLRATSFHRRWNLAKHALTIIKDNPFWGVGWGGFVRKLPPATFLQPVHNVYLLVLAELGVVGVSGVVLVTCEYLKKLEFKNYLLLITVYLLLFSVDHYFWTTTQGIYMLWVMISLF